MKYHLITYGCQMNVADSEEMARPLERWGMLQTADLHQADVVIMNTCTVRDQAEHRAWSNLGRLRRWKEELPQRVLIVAGCAASRWGREIQKRYPYIDLVAPATQIEQFPELVEKVLHERWNFAKETAEGFFGMPPNGTLPLHMNGDQLTILPRPLGERAGVRGGLAVDATVRSPSPTAPRQTSGGPASSVAGPWPPVGLDLSPQGRGNGSAALFGNENTAYVTIMRGCNYACSYCIVPQVRGRELYRPLPDILDEIKTKAAHGRSEVMLLGQTVNSYYWRPAYISPSPLVGEGGDEGGPHSESAPHPLPLPLRHKASADAPTTQWRGGERVQGEGDAPAASRVYDFADLLRAVNALPGVERIRFMSPHPRHMRDRVIQTMADCPKVCRHVHLPVQSGSNRLLLRMKRLYTRAEYMEIVRKLRAAMPGLLITTDIIVGYPGETQEDFEETLALLQEARFDGLFAFRFSPRPGTAAAREADNVPRAVKEERLQQVLAFARSPVFS